MESFSKIAEYKSAEDGHSDKIYIVKWVRLEIANEVFGQFVTVSKDKSMKLWDTRHHSKPVFTEKYKDTWIFDIAICSKDSSGASQTTLVSTISNRKDEIVFYEFSRKTFKVIKKFKTQVKKCLWLSPSEVGDSSD